MQPAPCDPIRDSPKGSVACGPACRPVPACRRSLYGLYFAARGIDINDDIKPVLVGLFQGIGLCQGVDPEFARFIERPLALTHIGRFDESYVTFIDQIEEFRAVGDRPRFSELACSQATLALSPVLFLRLPTGPVADEGVSGKQTDQWADPNVLCARSEE